MLSGLSPDIISLTNTLLASLIAGALGILAASITQLDPTRCRCRSCPALAAALMAVHLVRHRGRRRLGIGIIYSLIHYASAQSWFPTVRRSRAARRHRSCWRS